MQIKPIHPNYKNGTWKLPTYKTDGSAGLDLIAAIESNYIIYADEKQSTIIPLGLAIWIDDPRYMLIFVPKSGLGCKKGLKLGNSIGIVDSDYQGELKACVVNRGEQNIVIKPGDFVCQGIFVPVIQPILHVVDEFTSNTIRGSDGGINRN